MPKPSKKTLEQNLVERLTWPLFDKSARISTRPMITYRGCWLGDSQPVGPRLGEGPMECRY